MKYILFAIIWVACGIGSLYLMANKSPKIQIGYIGATTVVAIGPVMSLFFIGDHLPCALNCDVEWAK